MKALQVPKNVSLLQLPPRAPELNGQENIWQFMRQNWLSNWISNPSTISSITAATLGTRSSISRGKSCPSPAAIGQPQVTQSEDWHYLRKSDVSADIFGYLHNIRSAEGEPRFDCAREAQEYVNDREHPQPPIAGSSRRPPLLLFSTA